MKQNPKLKIVSAFLIFSFLFLSMPPIFFKPATAEAFVFFAPPGVYAPFGGNIVEKNLHFCFRKAPPPIYFLIFPFYVFLVYNPTPAGLYWIFGFSELFLEYEFEKSANSLGNYLIGGDIAWRQFCDINGQILPKSISGKTWFGAPWKMPVMGLARKMGTSCRVDPKFINDDCHKRVRLRGLKDTAKLAVEIAVIKAALAILQKTLLKQFDPKSEPDYCDPNSPQGECLPIGTCDAEQLQLDGNCDGASGNPP